VLAAALALQRVQAVVAGVHVEHIATIGGGALHRCRWLGLVAVGPPELGGVITVPGTTHLGVEGLVDVVGEECAVCPGCAA